MKKVLLSLLVAAAINPVRADVFESSFTTQTITITGDSYDLDFAIYWTSNDYPITGTPGRVELVNSYGWVVASAQASVTMTGNYVSASLGTVTVRSTKLTILAQDLSAADGEFYGTWNISGVSAGTYTLRFWDYTNAPTPIPVINTVWTHTFSQGGRAPPPPPSPMVVTLLAPGDQTVAAGTTLTISARATDAAGRIANHNLDIQRPDGAWNFEGGFATGEPYQGGPVGSGGDSIRSASFTFSDVGTYHVRSAAFNGVEWEHSATVTITVTAPPPTYYTLVTVAGAGGSVSPGGTFTAGTVVTVGATADATHDFSGWNGDTAGTANPLGVLMDRNRTVQALYTPKSFAVITGASAGGSVTPGGTYAYGATVTVSAAADATHRFVGWTGDASGASPAITLTVTRTLTVEAIFTTKTGQTILFPSITDQGVNASFPLNITSSSGLPVTLAVSGPTTYVGGVLTITGPGVVSIQATQAGDEFYLPAVPVTRTFNAAVPAVVKFSAPKRTFLQNSRSTDSPTYLLQANP